VAPLFKKTEQSKSSDFKEVRGFFFSLKMKRTAIPSLFHGINRETFSKNEQMP